MSTFMQQWNASKVIHIDPQGFEIARASYRRGSFIFVRAKYTRLSKAMRVRMKVADGEQKETIWLYNEYRFKLWYNIILRSIYISEWL
jgi:hypothetical protein